MPPMLVALAVCVPKLWQGDFTVDTGWYAALALQAYRGISEAGLAAYRSLQRAAEAAAAPHARTIARLARRPPGRS